MTEPKRRPNKSLGCLGTEAEDLTGRKFGRLTVVSRVKEGHPTSKKPWWVCVCECGETTRVQPANLKKGNTKSCGCLLRSRTKKESLIRHVTYHTRAYKLFAAARRRADLKGLPFNLDLEDVVIPTHCPVLGLAIDLSKQETSASIDRIVPSLGYVKGNVRVISFRANRIKTNASPAELKAVAEYAAQNSDPAFYFG